MDTNYDSVHILTDSLSSTYALSNIFPGNDIIKNIFDLMINNLNKTVYASWVKAHVGLCGNERADCLAKEAISGGDYVDMPFIKFPKSCLKNWLNNKVLEDWQSYWNGSDKGRDTSRVINKVNKDFLCANQVVQYFITGHGSFPSFLYNIKKKPNPLCECGDTGTVTHYLFSRCPLVPFFFEFDRSRTLRQNLRRILFDNRNYNKLCETYNCRNSKYSFIKYKF